MNATAQTAAKIETPCDKCDGSGRIMAFSSIHNGLCFRCGGTGLAPVGATNPWVKVGPSVPAPACREVVLGALGPAFIERDGAGFKADIGRAVAWFSVKGGRIADLVVSDGLRGQRAAVQAALQAALRV